MCARSSTSLNRKLLRKKLAVFVSAALTGLRMQRYRSVLLHFTQELDHSQSVSSQVCQL